MTATPGRPDAPLSSSDKSIPAWADGLSLDEFLADTRLSKLSTPALVLDDAALTSNIARFAAWCAARRIDLEPHGKTTMAPALWDRQLDAGATAITVANYPQLRVAVAAGIRSIHLANTLADPSGISWLGRSLEADPELSVVVWADAPRAVELLHRGLGEANRRLGVLVELGAPGARSGVRGVAGGIEVARAVAASPRLRLAGVAGYEGALAHDAQPDSLHRIDGYLRDLAELHRRLGPLYPKDGGRIVVSAGGSAYFDRVAELLGPLRDARTSVVIRAGVYVIHDDGFYASVTPSGRRAGPELVNAMHLFARVVSRPEPGLAFLDVGRRDVSFDDGLPIPRSAASGMGAPSRPLPGVVTAVNDQHAFLELDPADPLKIGDVVRLGLSHPCTALDKWRSIPVVADMVDDDPAVVDLLSTYF